MKTKRLGDGHNKNTIKVTIENYKKLAEIRNLLDKKYGYKFRASMNDAIDYLLEKESSSKTVEVNK